jgi:hypothetical protein
MKKLLPCAEAVVLFCFAIAGSAGAQIVGTTSPPPSTPSWVAPLLPLTLNMVSATPPLADDPLLDSNGNVVVDSSGNPVSDPNESFHQVKPTEFDPDHTQLVQAAWLAGTGCPPSDSACAAYSDSDDQHNEGLLLAKTGPTSNNAAAIAELKKVRGTAIHELGYDIRKQGLPPGTPGSTSPLGSHCGAGAPRFDIVTSDSNGQHVFFIGCNSPPADSQNPSDTGWIRLRWGTTGTTSTPLSAFSADTGLLTDISGMTVERIFIVFDEGQDASGGPDQFGAAFLDNVDVNGELVGRGSTDAASR